MPKYVPPFDMVKLRLAINSVDGKAVASVDYEDLQEIVQLFLRGVEVDEAWYLRQYPDVAEAIQSGVVPSARAHFIANGYFEGRLPFPLEVDSGWYAEAYPDIGSAIENGDFSSAVAHYREYGYAEGRLPSAVR